MIKIAIIDDEVNVRTVIKKLLKLISSEYEIVGEAASIAGAKSMLSNTKPDIVLLDIELEDGTGFGLLDQLTTIDFKLIFITAFNQYAIKAFKYNALDYILKPIDPQELKTTLERVRSTVYSEKDTKALFDNLQKNKNSEASKIVIKTSKQIHFIDIDRILYCRSEGSYTQIITEDTTILASKNLKHYQELLPATVFIRTHQSFLVNKENIVGLKSEGVSLKNNEIIPVSTRRKSTIKALLLKK